MIKKLKKDMDVLVSDLKQIKEFKSDEQIRAEKDLSEIAQKDEQKESGQ